MLEIKNLSFHYPEQPESSIIQNLNLEIPTNQLIVFLGGSGCGKSTLIQLIAGLISPSSGCIKYEGEEILGPSLHRGLVFQQFSLFPWLNVADNVTFGLKLKKTPPSEQEYLLDHYLQLTKLSPYRNYYPRSLSGGMQQRVAIARTLVNNPNLILMDEPFGSLDPEIREQMQDFILQIYQQEKKTILFITHDVREALFLADSIYVFTPNPLRVKAHYPITFPRPRTHELKYTDAFFELEKQLVEDLRT